MSQVASSQYRQRHVVFTSIDDPSNGPTGKRPPRRRYCDGGGGGVADLPLLLKPDVGAFLTWLLGRASLDLSDYQPSSLLRRLPACLRLLKAETIDRARVILRREPALIAPAISSLVIGVTRFFREPTVLADLDALILPQLSKRASSRAWSVGCSDGSELASLAMLLDEAGTLGRWHLLGTDCRVDAIRAAEAGIYSEQAVKFIPQPLANKCLIEQEGLETPAGRAPIALQYRLKAELRAAMSWTYANVLRSAQPGPWDLILCRNVMIYLQRPASQALWASLAASLRVGGTLVVGKAELPTPGLPLVRRASCIYQKVGV